jgi:hypothetical protein
MKGDSLPGYVEGGREVLRVFLMPEDDNMIVLLNVTALDADPAGWGVLLVDVAHHAANAYVRRGIRKQEQHDNKPVGDPIEVTRDDILERIRFFFDAEWENRTSEAKPIDH